MLGDGRLRANCDDGTERICIIRGKMKRRVWIRPNDILIVALRCFENGKADVVVKYTDDELSILVQLGEVSVHFMNRGLHLCEHDLQWETASWSGAENSDSDCSSDDDISSMEEEDDGSICFQNLVDVCKRCTLATGVCVFEEASEKKMNVKAKHSARRVNAKPVQVPIHALHHACQGRQNDRPQQQIQFGQRANQAPSRNRISVPSEVAGLVIGRAGKRLQEMEDQFGVCIQRLKQNGNCGRVSFEITSRQSLSAVSHCMQHIQRIVSNALPSSSTCISEPPDRKKLQLIPRVPNMTSEKEWPSL